MIVIHDFTETHRLYQSEQIPLRVMQEQAMVLFNLAPRPGRHFHDALEIAPDSIEWLVHHPISSRPYDALLGGNAYVCEAEADLLSIVGMNLDFAAVHGRWPNVTECAIAWDDCGYLPEKDGLPQWAFILNLTNDSGGPVYYIPQPLWIAARIDEHIAATGS